VISCGDLSVLSPGFLDSNELEYVRHGAGMVEGNGRWIHCRELVGRSKHWRSLDETMLAFLQLLLVVSSHLFWAEWSEIPFTSRALPLSVDRVSKIKVKKRRVFC